MQTQSKASITGQQIRATRAGAGIAAALLSTKAGIDRAKLSRIECGYIEPTSAEAARLKAALDELAAAREKVAAVAAEVGWPMPA